MANRPVILRKLATRHHVAVDHVDDLELLAGEARRSPAAQQSSSTMTAKLSSARLRTVEETHWSVKMPQQTTVLMPRLCRIRRRLVPGQRAVGGLGDDDLVADGCSSGTSCEAARSSAEAGCSSPASSATASGRGRPWCGRRCGRTGIRCRSPRQVSSSACVLRHDRARACARGTASRHRSGAAPAAESEARSGRAR